MTWERTSRFAVGFTVFVFEGDGLIVDGEDAVVGDSKAKDIAAEIIENKIFAFAPPFDVDNEGLLPQFGGQIKTGAALFQGGEDARSDQFTERSLGKEEVFGGRMPSLTILGEAAAGDEAMNMGVQSELLVPGVEHSKDANGSPDPGGIASQLDDRFSGGGEERAIADPLVAVEDRA